MSYTPKTWHTGDTVTATDLNNIENGIANAGGSSWDAVIRLTHADNSGGDIPANLTPSIVSGTFEELYNKLSTGGYPCILVEYYHPWGGNYAAPMAYVTYYGSVGISIRIAGFLLANNGSLGVISTELYWSDADTLDWN